MQLLPLTRDNIIAVRVKDTLTAEEFDHFKKLVDHTIEQYGEVKIYFEMEEFEGWHAGTFLDNALFDIVHAHQFSKVAMVGEKTWQAWLSKLVNLVKRGEVKYFDLTQRVQAMEWIQHGSLRSLEGLA